MAKLLWEWKVFAVALVVRGLLIVTSHTNCDVTSCRYANAYGDEQWYKTLKTQVSIAFCKIVIVVEYKLTIYTVCAVDGRHNSCCAGLQYQPLQRRPYRGEFL